MKNVDTTKEREARFSVPFEASTGYRGERSAMPGGIRSEKGIVLVVVLVLSAVVLAVMTALLYMILSGTQISGLQKRYRTSLEAAKGGSDLFYQVIGTRGDTSSMTGVNPPSDPVTCSGQDMYGTTYTGFQAKLRTPSATWSANCDKTLSIDTTNSNSYDMVLVVGTAPAPQYRYYAKIVATQEGNSASAGNSSLYTGSVYTGSNGIGAIPVVSRPYLYAIEVDTENINNPTERAKLSILYQY